MNFLKRRRMQGEAGNVLWLAFSGADLPAVKAGDA